MNEEETTGGVSAEPETRSAGPLSLAADSGAKKAGEIFAERLLDRGFTLAIYLMRRLGVRLGWGFSRYLKNAARFYNRTTTIATGQQVRTMIGERDSLYVEIGVSYREQEIQTHTAEEMLKVSNTILIEGTGGAGKSMLMRYLFLHTAGERKRIPVLVELRKISAQNKGNVSLLNAVYASMEQYDVQLPRDLFEDSLRLGKYLFLLDGFDEIRNELAVEAAAEIQNFSKKYPQNAYIVTSRHRPNETVPLRTFSRMKTMPMNLKQAQELARRIGRHSAKAEEFSEQLREKLYEQHKDFAQNPLLLSMMVLTYEFNNDIPNHLTDFYDRAYYALYTQHDTMHKAMDRDVFHREFKSKGLDEREFKKLFARFCFQTYFESEFEFSEQNIIKQINNSIQFLKYNSKVKPEEFLADLCDIVCLVVRDGEMYRFSHRSFQTYFAAYYTGIKDDEEQKDLFERILSSMLYAHCRGYVSLIAQLQPERFFKNALYDHFRNLFRNHKISDDFLAEYMKKISRIIHLPSFETTVSVGELFGIDSVAYHIFLLHYIQLDNSARIDVDKVTVADCVFEKFGKCEKLDFDDIDDGFVDHVEMSQIERRDLYVKIANAAGIPQTLSYIKQYVEEYEEKLKQQDEKMNDEDFYSAF